MGIPYSREINAAFEQVTPLVAAGFKVLKTTKNISILLAVIQVLTVLFLAGILLVLIAIVYCVDPGLAKERELMITPVFKYMAHITFIGMIKGVLASLVGFGGFVGTAFLLLHRRDMNSVEHEGNEDADKALEDLEDESEKKGGKKDGKKTKEDGKKDGGKKGKGDKGKNGKGKEDSPEEGLEDDTAATKEAKEKRGWFSSGSS